jgi:hypothetical protein
VSRADGNSSEGDEHVPAESTGDEYSLGGGKHRPDDYDDHCLLGRGLLRRADVRY